MDGMLYVAMTGAREAMVGQVSHSNNLANISTPGFKADLAQFRSQPVFGPGLPSRVFAMTERPATDFAPGPILSTGNDLDVAVNGDGFIAVQAVDGTEGYTRRGDLRISANGLLQTGDGRMVLGNGGPIAIPPAEKLNIGLDGTISIRPLGQAANTLAVVDRIKLVKPNPAELEKGDDGLFRLPGGEPVAADATVTIASGALEGSNVNGVDAMVRMITLAREFEMQVKLMEEAKSNDERAAQLLSIG